MRQRTAWTMLSAVCVLFSGAVWAGDDPEPLFPSGLGWQPGPVCTYAANQNGKKAEWKFEVTGVSGDRINGVWTQISPDPSKTIAVEKTENGLKLTSDITFVHGTQLTASPGYQWVAFPLAPKSKWESESVMEGTDSAGKPWKSNVKSSFKVGKWEKLKTSAGEGMALAVESKERITGVNANYSGSGDLKYWLGSGACSLKKLEYRNSFKEWAKVELVSESTR